MLTWKYFWKYPSGKNIDFYSCYFSNHLAFFTYLPHTHCGFSHFPLLPSLLGLREGICKYHLNDEVTCGPHNLVILWLVTEDLAKKLVALPCVPFIFSVALKFCVLCYGCCMSLQWMFSIVEVHCCPLAVFLWVQSEGVAPFTWNHYLQWTITKLDYSSFHGHSHLNCLLSTKFYVLENYTLAQFKPGQYHSTPRIYINWYLTWSDLSIADRYWFEEGVCLVLITFYCYKFYFNFWF